MIKINLLAEGKHPAAVRKSKPAATVWRERGAELALGGALLLALLAGGIWWLVVHGQLTDRREEVADARRVRDELQDVIDQVERFEAQKTELEHKIEVINELKANQRGPVQVMDFVSRALPELLWLDRMVMRPSTLVLTGQAFNMNAIANFMDSLDDVPQFREPVLKDASRRGRVFGFTVELDYDMRTPSREELLAEEELELEADADDLARETATEEASS